MLLAHASWKPFAFFSRRHPGCMGWSRFYFVKLMRAYAQGIAAEILFCGCAAKKIGAESPVLRRSRKMRPNSEL
jgi:hypothetical protein